MALEIDPKIDVSEAPAITLAGRQFFVPRLMLRQMIRVGPLVPAALKFLKRVRPAALKLGSEDEAIKAGGEAFTDDERLSLIDAATLTEGEQETALRMIVAALTRAYPKAVVDDLLDLPIKAGEIIVALPTIFAQIGDRQTAQDAAPGEG